MTDQALQDGYKIKRLFYYKSAVTDGLFSFLLQQKDNYILWIPLLFAQGIGAYFILKQEPSVYFTAFLFVILCPLFVLSLYQRTKSEFQYCLSVFVTALFILCLGFATAQLRTHNVHAPVLLDDIRVTSITGTVAKIHPTNQGQTYKVVLTDLNIEDLKPEETPAKIRVKFWDIGQVKHGDTIRFTAGLNPPSAPTIPGGFDFQRHAFFQQIGAYGFAYGKADIIRSEGSHPLLIKIAHLRENVINRIKVHEFDASSTSLLVTLMTGHKTILDPEDTDALRKAGLAHILAISGLHIGMVAGFLFFLIRWGLLLNHRFAIEHPIKKYAAIGAILCTLFYVLMVGSAIPAVRAFLMTSIVLMALVFDRMPFSMRLVAVAATVILVVKPESLLSPSFQLSFAAVASLIFFYQETRGFWVRQYQNANIFKRSAFYLLAVIATTLIASLATAPLILFHFQELPLHNSIVSNLLAMPVLSFIVMPFCVLSYILMPLSLDFVPMMVAAKGATFILAMAHDLAEWENSIWRPQALPLISLVSLSVGILLFMAVKGRVRLLGFVFVFAAIIPVTMVSVPDLVVSETGKVVVIKDDQDNLWISQRRSERFISDSWVTYFGYEDKGFFSWNDYKHTDINQQRLLSCDEMSCLAIVDGHPIAFPKHPSSIDQDCNIADIIISRFSIRNSQCNVDTIIDWWDLRNNGAHAIWLAENRILTVREERGKRPWVYY